LLTYFSRVEPVNIVPLMSLKPNDRYGFIAFFIDGGVSISALVANLLAFSITANTKTLPIPFLRNSGLTYGLFTDTLGELLKTTNQLSVFHLQLKAAIAAEASPGALHLL